MKTPIYEKAPPFDPEHMERRTGEDRQVPIPLDYEQAHAHAKQANTAYRMAKVVRGEAATALSLAKTADATAKKDLEEAFEEAEKGRAEADSLTRTISAKVQRHFDYRTNVVREVRLDPGYEGVLFDEYDMTDDERSDLLGTGKAKPPAETLTAGDDALLRTHVETAWEHRHPADRAAFINDVMQYSSWSTAAVEAAVDQFLAEQAEDKHILALVAGWMDDDDVLGPYAGDTHEEMVSLLAGDISKDITSFGGVGGNATNVTVDDLRRAVDIVVTRGQRDLLLGKLNGPGGLPLVKGTTPKALATQTGLDQDRVKALLASARTDGLADKPKGMRSWHRVPVAERQRLLAALPLANTMDTAGEACGRDLARLVEITALPGEFIETQLLCLLRDGLADRLKGDPLKWVRLKAEEPATSPGEFEGEEFDAAMLADGPARERVIAKLVAKLWSADAVPARTRTPQDLADDTDLHLLDVGKLLAWAKEAGLARIRRGSKDGWVRLPAAVVADPHAPEQ